MVVTGASPALALPRSEQLPKPERFYLPELDILRLIAFASVFIVHGPRFGGRGWFKETYNTYAGAGAMGLALFFFLSSYLITELLLREKERTRTIHLKSFYIRRILRIWPLYYFAIAIAIAYGFLRPEVRMGWPHILQLIFLVGWLNPTADYNPFGVLWSISVEEMFYALWPGIAKLGFTRLISVLLIPISLAAVLVPLNSWYDPVVHFLYFASGALAALALHRKTWRLPLPVRVLSLCGGVAIWLLAYSPFVSIWLFKYVLGDLGCILLFLSILGLRKNLCPRPLIYLGTISYGLYVFHLAYLYLISQWINELIKHDRDLLRFGLTASISLLLTIGTAALSYRYLETPFLTLKRRFEYVRSK